MTDAATDARSDRDSRLAWRVGGVLLLACAAVSLVAVSLIGGFAYTLMYWLQTTLFGLALIVFAFGFRGAGSVVARQPLGMGALVVLAVWPPIDGLFGLLVPFTMDVAELYMAWGYVSLAVQLGAGIVAVVAIARAGAVPSPWRWAPLWAAIATVLPQLILQLVAASPGADVQAMAAPMAGLAQLVAVGVPLVLGLCAVLLAARRSVAEPVQVYPPPT